MKNFMLLILSAAMLAANAAAAGPSIWTIASRADVLKGDARSVSIDQNGTISPAPRVQEVFDTRQSYIWSTAVDAAGSVYLGTGSEGRIYKVTPAGAGSLFADLGELNVSAIAIDRTGRIFAGTSPDGKVYLIDQAGTATVYFDPGEKYIWSLAIMADGSLAVGTGEAGKIYRVRAAGAARETSLFYDSSDTHIISMAADTAGNLICGTDPGGIVLRIGADGRAFALLDSPLREIHEVALGSDGTAYALAIGESASVATPPAPQPAGSPEARTVSVERPSAAPEQAKSRYDLAGAKSAVYRIAPDGGADVMWASASITGFSLFADPGGDGVWLGTSDKGRIYRIASGLAERLLLQTDAGQISSIFSRGGQVHAATSNQGRLLRIGPDPVPEGIYESPILDAKASAGWGRAWWRSSCTVEIQTRSGNTEKPEETWSPWARVEGTGTGQVASPRARFLQWRAVLRSTPRAPSMLHELSLAYAARNIAPEITSIQVLAPNVGLIANPPIQVDPNIELTGLDPHLFGIAAVQVPPRKAFLRGARSFQWTAEDRNGDRIVYDVFYRSVDDTAFKLLRSDQPENFYTLDGQALADGRYIIKIVAKDWPSNAAASALSGERISEPFDIDNTQPAVTAAGDRTRVVFSVTDRSGYVVRAEYSINGGPWQCIDAEDGISDSASERYIVPVPGAAGDYDITLRAFDAAGNSGNARFVVRKN